MRLGGGGGGIPSSQYNPFPASVERNLELESLSSYPRVQFDPNITVDALDVRSNVAANVPITSSAASPITESVKGDMYDVDLGQRRLFSGK